MDKTVEIMLVAVVSIIVALIAVSLVQGQATGFNDFTGGQTEGAECSVWQTRIDNCEATTSNVPSDVSEACSLNSQPSSCDDG